VSFVVYHHYINTITKQRHSATTSERLRPVSGKKRAFFRRI
jgi:hypothetical protein